MKTGSGIYVIRNLANGKIYIGSAMNLARRCGQHHSDLRHGRHRNHHLQSAWNKYGAVAFVFEILEECEVHQLIEREQWWLDVGQPDYNTCTMAYSLLGHKHSAEARARISAANMGKTMSAESRAKISAANVGKKASAESRARMSAASTGRIISPAQRAKLSKANKGKPWSQARWQAHYRQRKDLE